MFKMFSMNFFVIVYYLIFFIITLFLYAGFLKKLKIKVTTHKLMQ